MLNPYHPHERLAKLFHLQKGVEMTSCWEFRQIRYVSIQIFKIDFFYLEKFIFILIYFLFKTFHGKEKFCGLWNLFLFWITVNAKKMMNIVVWYFFVWTFSIFHVDKRFRFKSEGVIKMLLNVGLNKYPAAISYT
jgi:hypothetical protein